MIKHIKNKIKKKCIYCGNSVIAKNKILYCSDVCLIKDRSTIYIPKTQLDTEDIDNMHIIANRNRATFISKNSFIMPYEDIED